MLNIDRLLHRLNNVRRVTKGCRKRRISAALTVLVVSITLCGYAPGEASQIKVAAVNNLDNSEMEEPVEVLLAFSKSGEISSALQSEKVAVNKNIIESPEIISAIKAVNVNIEAKIEAAELTEAKINTAKAISADKIIASNTVKAVNEIKSVSVSTTQKVKKVAATEAVKEKAKIEKKTVQRKLSSEDYEVLLRIVEAEATGEDLKGKILVANVVLNRVDHKQFPNSVKSVVFQKNGSTVQFSPTKDGRYWSVKVSKDSKEAVKRALAGEDYSKGALFFSARARANKNSMSWFDRNLKWLFKHGAHEFYTTKK